MSTVSFHLPLYPPKLSAWAIVLLVLFLPATLPRKARRRGAEASKSSLVCFQSLARSFFSLLQWRADHLVSFLSLAHSWQRHRGCTQIIPNLGFPPLPQAISSFLVNSVPRWLHVLVLPGFPSRGISGSLRISNVPQPGSDPRKRTERTHPHIPHPGS